MTTEMTDNQGVEETTEDEDSGFRAHTKNVEAENKGLREQVLNQHIEAIGLDPAKELGLAISEGYTGDFTAESVADFAKEKYSYEHESGEPVSDNAEKLEDQETKRSVVTGTSEAVTPTSPQSRIEQLDEALADPEVDGPAVAKVAIEEKLQGFVQANYSDR
jgi:hypothetical protein